ncbi:cytochrome P450 2J6-like [Acanthaster planci]|uniref:Cytochrome P450 2J6-like n=1 Tax=Acanthaster planci TaxID=133434 RepID=A0A8B7YX09_ACAPL|nr:cytochrome P450 2J6-like [Acanthaster planci]
MSHLQNILWFLDVHTVLLCLVLLLILRWFFGRPKNLPPGPWGFPIVGSITAVVREIRRGVQPHNLFMRYAAKYGPVFHIRILNKTVVVLNNYASVKEAFQNPQLNDRPKLLFTELFRSEAVGAASGEPWIELRRFCLTVLRSFGVGKTSFEEKIGEEAEALMKEMSAFNGKPFNPKPLLSNATSNVICSVIFGKRYDYSDEEFQRLLSLFGQNVRLAGAGGVFIFFPALRHLPFVSSNQLDLNMAQVRKFLTNIINSHRVAFDSDNLNDFTDVFLKEIKSNEEKAKAGVKHGHLTENSFVGTVGNLFVAGTETTATTLQWAILYMAVYPEIQKRVQAEIDDVVGRNRLPRMADKPELNFTRAVIWEVQRLTIVAPLGLAHAAASDTQFRGFTIPKGALLVPNLWAVARDPNVWQEPNQFKPERFLNAKGEAVKADELIPFSVGRRSCIGEHLAKMELVIFFSYLMHQFTFKKPDDSPPLSLKARGGFTNSPVVFDICVSKRD